MRKLDIGIAVYGNPVLLQKTIQSIEMASVTDYRLLLIVNPHPDEEQRQAAERIVDAATARNPRITIHRMPVNAGYAGAVNELLSRSQTEYIAYTDGDVEILTPGWDETLCSYLDRFHELGIIHPNGGAYPIPRGPYTEIQWAAGFAWVINRLCYAEVGGMDQTIGHQNECDLAMRVRMAGWKCAAAPEVRIAHHATATNDPAATERINRGVREFVDKWNRYFNGKNFNYHSVNVTRWLDWPPNALYMEEYFKANGLGEINTNPEETTINGEKYDLVKSLRLSGFYRNRVF